MRTSGDLRCRPLLVWRSGILGRLPSCIDHAIVDAITGVGRNGWGAALLMRDVSEALVPEGDTPISLEQHTRFIDHMAALHAAYWGWKDTIGLTSPMTRYLEFNPVGIGLEANRGWPDAVPPLIIEGWAKLVTVAGPLGASILELTRDPSPLVTAMATLPQTFVHGDWKLGNLGSLPDGRTVLLDWAMPGEACPTAELAWYLALNVARLPHSKDDTIALYRKSLERHGISTAGWWERSIALALLGGAVNFGWEKALGGQGAELSWWLDRAEEGQRWLEREGR